MHGNTPETENTQTIAFQFVSHRGSLQSEFCNDEHADQGCVLQTHCRIKRAFTEQGKSNTYHGSKDQANCQICGTKKIVSQHTQD